MLNQTTYLLVCMMSTLVSRWCARIFFSARLFGDSVAAQPIKAVICPGNLPEIRLSIMRVWVAEFSVTAGWTWAGRGSIPGLSENQTLIEFIFFSPVGLCCRNHSCSLGFTSQVTSPVWHPKAQGVSFKKDNKSQSGIWLGESTLLALSQEGRTICFKRE